MDQAQKLVKVGPNKMAEISATVAAAINQLNANQQAMQQQFAAFFATVCF